VEVTEDAFATKTWFQDEIVPILRKLGVGISIDDFSTGYSLLSALADITADEIKIDRSFTKDNHLRPRSREFCGRSNRWARHSAGRPMQENRQAYARPSRYRR
jgi:EAL domain-containing protein (putative c-di-GMP-specific phosphodiesterase class I)